MNRIFYFISYLIRSFHLHGIHPPFAFNLTNDILRSKSKYYAYDEIESIKAKLLLTQKEIQIEDLGAKGGSYKKSIRDICRNSSQKSSFAQLIHKIALNFKPKTILELGTSLGLTTSHLAKACPNAKIISIEGSREIAKVAKANLKKLDIQYVKSEEGAFDEKIDGAIEELESLDLVYFDGNHTYEATMDYFQKCLAKAEENSIFIFDDIYWSAGMKKAWNQIATHECVTTSIDLFQLGIVFFDTKLSKQQLTVFHPANFSLS